MRPFTVQIFLFVALSFGAAAQEITVGATLAVSGNLAFIGNAQARGLGMAFEILNKDPGAPKLRLAVEDNAGEPKQAVSGITKLLNIEHADIIFSSFSHITNSIKSAVKQSGKPMLYAAALGGIAAEGPLFFRDWGDAKAQGSTMGRAVLMSGKRRVAAIGEISDACSEVAEGFKIATGDRVELIADEQYTPGETDFRSILLRVAAKKPEILFLCVWRDSGQLMNQIRALGMIGIPTVHMMAPFLPVNDTPEVRKVYEENGAVSVWLGFPPGMLDGPHREFALEYFKRYGEYPRVEAALAYDDGFVLAAAARPCFNNDMLDGACFSSKLIRTDYSGAAGRLQFDGQRRSHRQDMLIHVRNGQWEIFSE